MSQFKVGDKVLWTYSYGDMRTAVAVVVEIKNNTVMCNNWSDISDKTRVFGDPAQNFRLLTPLEELL